VSLTLRPHPGPSLPGTALPPGCTLKKPARRGAAQRGFNKVKGERLKVKSFLSRNELKNLHFSFFTFHLSLLTFHLILMTFSDFALGVYPFLELQPFHRTYYRVLEAFAAGRIRRLIVTMPPQHGKSVGATTLLPAYLLGLDPDLRVAVASYSGSLASKFNRRVQRILESREYAAFFPGTAIKQGAKPAGYIRTADEVEIIGRRGGLLSVGREGSLTGNRVDCFVLDDLYRK